MGDRSYQQIISKAKEQGIDFTNKHIVIPIGENKLSFDGDTCFGKICENKDIIYVFQDVESNYSPTGFDKEPFIYNIADKYSTYLSNGTVTHFVEFYTVEY